jgi:hypothetical protein
MHLAFVIGLALPLGGIIVTGLVFEAREGEWQGEGPGDD